MVFDGPFKLPFEAEAAVPLRFPQGNCQRAYGCCASPEQGGQASGPHGTCACGAWHHHMRMPQCCMGKKPWFLKATLRPSNTAYGPGPPGQKSVAMGTEKRSSSSVARLLACPVGLVRSRQGKVQWKELTCEHATLCVCLQGHRDSEHPAASHVLNIMCEDSEDIAPHPV